MEPRHSVVAVVMGAALLATTPVSASAETTAAKARAAEEALDYDIAVDLWMVVISDPKAGDDLLLEAHYRSGVLQCIRGNDSAAHMHFRYVLQRDPGLDPGPDMPPKVRGLFEMVRAEVRDEAARRSAAEASRSPASESAPGRSQAPESDNTVQVALYVIGGTFASLGVVAAGTGAIVGAAAVAEHDAAAGSQIQLDRLTHMEQRDTLATAANVTFAAAGAGLLVGIALLVGGVVSGP